MRGLRKLAAAQLAILGVLALGQPANASEKGKIYLGEGWVDAQSQIGSSPSASFFGDLFGSAQALNLTQIVQNFLGQNASLLQMDRDATWAVTQTVRGNELQTQRLNKTWRGLPVVGGDAVVQVQNGSVAFANADNTPLTSVSSSARLSGEEARAVAFSSYRGSALRASKPELKVLILGQGAQKEARLVYQVTVHDRDQLASDIHFIDANSAAEVLVSTNVHTLSNRQVLAGVGAESDFGLDESTWKTIYADKGCALNGTLSASASRPSPCANLDARVMASASSAWDNSGLVFSYYETTHLRNSIDNAGMLLKSVVNFGGAGFPNAAWYNDKSVMLYGIGDETRFHDFAKPLDVAAHEITHGITSRTANLEYVAESGALNESYSDVFGKLVAFKNNRGNDWKLGRELFRNGTDFIRDMESPDIGHTRDFRYRGETCSRYNDFCGVHSNSGIPNKAAVLLAKRIGNEKLGKIYYLTLTQLLRTNSSFAEAKAQSIAACGTLFGATSADCKAVEESFAAVGI